MWILVGEAKIREGGARGRETVRRGRPSDRDGEQLPVSVIDRYDQRLRALLADPAQGPALRADLASGFNALPAWMQDLLRHSLAQDLAPQPAGAASA